MKNLDLASRSQLQQIHSLGTNRNASRVLKQLTPYLNSFRDIEQIYYLNKAGRDKVGALKTIAKTSSYKHTLMRNDIYVKYSCPKAWQNEYVLKADGLHFIADSVFMQEGQMYFLEVDNQQKMMENKKKLENYKRFKDTGLWQNKNGGTFPTLVFYTVSQTRKAQLQELNPGLNLLVYTVEDLF